MGLTDDIKKSAMENGTKIQSLEAQKIEDVFNKLFYASKNIDEEVKFVKQMFTRGGSGEERIGLHTSAIIVSDNEFCFRQQVLSLLYKQLQGEQLPVKQKRIFEEGNSIHEKWQRLFIRGGLGKAEHMDFSMFCDEYDIGYTPDAKIRIPELGKYIVEIKSMNDYQYCQAISFHPSAKKQVNMYMHFERMRLGKDDFKGIVLCENKNTQDFKVFVEPYNPDIVAPYIERLEGVQHYLRQVMEESKMVARCAGCTSYLSKRALKCPMRDAILLLDELVPRFVRLRQDGERRVRCPSYLGLDMNATAFLTLHNH
jgi:hypothetical protein